MCMCVCGYVGVCVCICVCICICIGVCVCLCVCNQSVTKMSPALGQLSEESGLPSTRHAHLVAYILIDWSTEHPELSTSSWWLKTKGSTRLYAARCILLPSGTPQSLGKLAPVRAGGRIIDLIFFYCRWADPKKKTRKLQLARKQRLTCLVAWLNHPLIRMMLYQSGSSFKLLGWTQKQNGWKLRPLWQNRSTFLRFAKAAAGTQTVTKRPRAFARFFKSTSFVEMA